MLGWLKDKGGRKISHREILDRLIIIDTKVTRIEAKIEELLEGDDNQEALENLARQLDDLQKDLANREKPSSTKRSR
jgi:hypothetical protein